MTKTVNYTPEVVAQMVATYQDAGEGVENEAARDQAIDQIAENIGKTVASVRSKLSHLKVYIPKAKVESAGTGRVTKSDKVQKIADFANHQNDAFFDSLTGANKGVLDYIIGLQMEVDALQTEIDAFGDVE